MSRYIEANRATFGVEPICQVLAVAPSSYYAARSRPPSARAIRDQELKADITRVHAANFSVYGVRKLWRALRRQGTQIGRDHAGRLMTALGLAGVVRGKTIRTTHPAPLSQRPADLVERVFSAAAPNRLWLADLTYVWTVRGFCYTAFIVDAYSRRIVGWRVASTLRTDLALDALEMAIWARGSSRRPRRSRPPQRSGCPGRAQGVVATLPCSAECRSPSRASAGVFQSRVLRGRVLSARATASRSARECRARSVPFGKYCRSSPFVFSLEPRCQGLCGSQK